LSNSHVDITPLVEEAFVENLGVFQITRGNQKKKSLLRCFEPVFRFKIN